MSTHKSQIKTSLSPSPSSLSSLLLVTALNFLRYGKTYLGKIKREDLVDYVCEVRSSSSVKWEKVEVSSLEVVVSGWPSVVRQARKIFLAD